jgi:hypothetical protein
LGNSGQTSCRQHQHRRLLSSSRQNEGLLFDRVAVAVDRVKFWGRLLLPQRIPMQQPAFVRPHVRT